MSAIRRRTFIAGLSGAAAWPVVAQAQQPTVPVVGFLQPGFPEGEEDLVLAFRDGLSKTGYHEGRTVAIEYRWANDDIDRLAELAADLVRRRVAVIATPGSMTAALAAKALTTMIPIVFSGGIDPVAAGLVASLNRPGGNVTGYVQMSAELMPKRIEIAHELIPNATRFGVLFNPTYSNASTLFAEMQAAASLIGLQIEMYYAATVGDIDLAFAAANQNRTEVLLVGPGAPFVNRRTQLALLAAYHRLPAIYVARHYAESGGLMSYGTNTAEQFREVGVYAGRILKGEVPGDLPVQRSVKFEFVINLQAAKVLGLNVPPTLLALADVVIE